MNLLVDFLCRFSFGLAVGLCITPAALVPSGFFRVNTLVLLGLTTFAALLSSTLGLNANTWLLSIAAIVSWVGSVLWYADRRQPGLVCCGGAAVLCAAATALTGEFTAAQVGVRILSGCLIGFTVNAMLLGHWYLVQPGLSREPIHQLVRWTGILWLPELILLCLPTGMFSVLNGTIDDNYNGLLGWFWVACVIATICLVGVTRMALKEKEYSAVMAATGLMYLAILTGFGMDLVARILLDT